MQDYKRPFSAAPFIYIFLQILFFGTSLIQCEKLTDLSEPIIIFMWINFVTTMIFFFFLHRRDPGFVPFENLALTEQSSRTVKPSNMISMHSTFRKLGGDRNLNEMDIITRPTPKSTEQDLKKEDRHQKYSMRQKILQSSSENTCRSQQESSNQLQNIGNDIKKQDEMQIIQEINTTNQSTSKKQDYEIEEIQTGNFEFSENKSNMQRQMVFSSELDQKCVQDHISFQNQDPQQQQQQEIEVVEQMQQNNGLEPEFQVECEHTQDNSFYQGGLSKLEDSNQDEDAEKQDFDINLSGGGNAANDFKVLPSNLLSKTPKLSRQGSTSGSKNRSKDKQSTEGTNSTGANATTAFTTSITKPNQEVQNKCQEHIIHIQEDNSKYQEFQIQTKEDQNLEKITFDDNITIKDNTQNSPQINHMSEESQRGSQRRQSEIKLKSCEDIYITKRFCQHCNLDQPVRSRHCKDCRRCVAMFDHHCPWVGTCIGEKNRCTFYWYLIFQAFQIIIPIIEMVDTMVSYDGDTFVKDNFMLVFDSLFATLLGLMVITLLIYHTFLAFSNLTTWEHVSWETITYLNDIDQNIGSPFSKNIKNNLKFYCQCKLFNYQLCQWKYQNPEVQKYMKN